MPLGVEHDLGHGLALLRDGKPLLPQVPTEEMDVAHGHSWWTLSTIIIDSWSPAPPQSRGPPLDSYTSGPRCVPGFGARRPSAPREFGLPWPRSDAGVSMAIA